MEKQEKEELMNLTYNYVRKNSTSKWVNSFLKDLKLAYTPTSVSYYLGLNMDENNMRFIH